MKNLHDIRNPAVTYLPTKRQAFIGIKSGYAEKILFYSFFKGGNAYPTYTYVCKIQEGSVLCEYMVNGNQIVYECYSNETENTIEYYSINYVKNGKNPVLEEKKAIIYKDLSCIKIGEYNNWMEPDGKQ